MTRNRRTRVINEPRDDPMDVPGAENLRSDLGPLYAGGGVALPSAEAYATEEDELNAVLAEAGGSQGAGSVVVRKTNPATRKFEWLAKFSTAEFVSSGGVAYLASKHGGGEYELLVYGVDNRIIKRPKITIAAEAIASIKEQETSGLSGIEKLAAVMMEGFKSLQLQLQQQQRPAESRADILREMAVMKELFGGGGSRDNSLDILAKVLPIVKDMVPREGDTNLLDVMMKLANEFGPSLRDAIGKTPAFAAPGNGAQPATPAAPAAPNISPEQIGANQMQLMLRAQLLTLCHEAERDADPGPYAEIIVSKVSPEMLSKLVNDPNWLDELAKIHSGVRLFPKWFGELRDAVVEVMQEPEPASDGDGGDEGINPQV